MKTIAPNTLVQLTQSYCDWANSTPDFPKTVKKYIDERRFFYLGTVPNMPNTCLLASFKGYIINCFSLNEIEEVILPNN